ncbi:hypothetical protein [Noviherbaspirillum aridicola]|nr:hypothetical protein [Noviherbaspirillum aridicola]
MTRMITQGLHELPVVNVILDFARSTDRKISPIPRDRLLNKQAAPVSF